MALGGAFAQQILELQLRVTAQSQAAFQQLTAGFKTVDEQAVRTAANLNRAFSPRLVQNMGQVRGKLVEQGTALSAFGAGLGQLDPRLQSLGVHLEELGVQQAKAGQSGKVQTAVLAQHATTLANAASWTEKLIAEEQKLVAVRMNQMRPLMTVVRASGTLTAQQQAELNSKLALNQASQVRMATLAAEVQALRGAAAGTTALATQTKAAALIAGTFGGEANFVAKAGQGMILSFSAAQAAAGNFEQAIFGLGFSLLFVNQALLGWPLVIGAVTTALTLGVPALIKWVSAAKDVETPTERGARLTEEFAAALKDVKGPLADVAEEMLRLEEGGPPSTIAVLAQQVLNASPPLEKYIQIQKAAESALKGWDARVLEAAEDTRSLHGNILTLHSAYLQDQNTLEDLVAVQDEFNKAIDETIAASRAELTLVVLKMEAARQEIADDQAREAALEALDAAYQASADAANAAYDAAVEGARNAAEAEVDALRENLEEQVQARRDALQEQTDAIRDALADRIDAINDERDAELEVSRERIDELKTLEQELTTAIRDLASQRGKAIQDILTTEAEIAELEMLIKKFGPDEYLESELALRKARQAALEQSVAGANAEIAAKEEARDAIDAQIDAEGERQDAIRDTAEVAVDAARKAADVQIREAERSTRAQINLMQQNVDAQINGINNARDAFIKSEDARRDAAIKTADRIRDAGRALQEQAGPERELLNLEAQRLAILERISFEQERNIGKMASLARAVAIINELLGRGFSAAQTALAVWMFLITQGISREAAQAFIAGQGLPTSGLPKFQGGGIVPGAIGSPQLVVAHGGEEIRKPAGNGMRGGNTYNLTVYVRSESDIMKISKLLNQDLGSRLATSLRTRRGTGR